MVETGLLVVAPSALESGIDSSRCSEPFIGGEDRPGEVNWMNSQGLLNDIF